MDLLKRKQTEGKLRMVIFPGVCSLAWTVIFVIYEKDFLNALSAAGRFSLYTIPTMGSEKR